ncbi:hypothetical protein M0R45_036306 [Rubus argutus]|uniref:Uncharacterized protein n=1 Tax=Rubus argutus TaxID=59490 RepID=A0AAW1W031_RUBAR
MKSKQEKKEGEEEKERRKRKIQSITTAPLPDPCFVAVYSQSPIHKPVLPSSSSPHRCCSIAQVTPPTPVPISTAVAAHQLAKLLPPIQSLPRRHKPKLPAATPSATSPLPGRDSSLPRCSPKPRPHHS